MQVLLADDQLKVRSALRIILEQQPGVEVVGETDDADGLMVQVDAIHPDLILLDWELPGLSRNGRFSALRSRHPDVRVIALSGRPEARRAALEAGADAFVSKVEPPDRLLEALNTIGQEVHERK